MLYTKYVSCVPHGFREDFLSFFHFKSMGAIDPRAWPVGSLWGLVVRIYVEDYQPLLHTKYISCGPHGFRKDSLSYSHNKSKEASPTAWLAGFM